MSAKEDFEKEFYEEVVELLILVKNRCNNALYSDNNFLRPSVRFLASVDIKTGIFSRETGVIQWLVKRKSFKYHRKGYGYNFKQFGIYHVKVRKCISIKITSNIFNGISNRYMLVKVLNKHAHHPELEKLQEHYKKPLIIKKAFGTFNLNRELSCFEGIIDCFGEEIDIKLETDELDGDTAYKAFSYLQKIYDNQKEWDEKLRKFAADELTECANDWLEAGSNEDTLTEITKEEFAKRISSGCLISICPDGEITVWYDDDDMFWGHTIAVYANISGEIERADIVG